MWRLSSTTLIWNQYGWWLSYFNGIPQGWAVILYLSYCYQAVGVFSCCISPTQQCCTVDKHAERAMETDLNVVCRWQSGLSGLQVMLTEEENITITSQIVIIIDEQIIFYWQKMLHMNTYLYIKTIKALVRLFRGKNGACLCYVYI